MKIKQTILFIFLTISIINATGKSKSHFEDSLKTEINFLKKSIIELEKHQEYQNQQINNQTGMIDTAFDGVSTELGSTSNTISVFGIIITIITVVLSIYLTRLEKNVGEMLKDSNTLLEKNVQIKQDLEILSEKITNDGTGLYKLIRNEESNHLIDRLISVPEDVVNLAPLLVSRDLEPEHFSKLKEAFSQVKNDPQFNIIYSQIFFQHFSGKSILDDEIKPLFIQQLNHCFEFAFKNDAIKSAADYFNSIAGFGLSKMKIEVNSYVAALCKSKFVNIDEVYFVIINEMKERELKFALYDLINKTPDTLIFRQKYGKLILDYNFEDLTLQENKTIADINKIILE